VQDVWRGNAYPTPNEADYDGAAARIVAEGRARSMRAAGFPEGLPMLPGVGYVMGRGDQVHVIVGDAQFWDRREVLALAAHVWDTAQRAAAAAGREPQPYARALRTGMATLGEVSRERAPALARLAGVMGGYAERLVQLVSDEIDREEPEAEGGGEEEEGAPPPALPEGAPPPVATLERVRPLMQEAADARLAATRLAQLAAAALG